MGGTAAKRNGRCLLDARLRGHDNGEIAGMTTERIEESFSDPGKPRLMLLGHLRPLGGSFHFSASPDR